jgi:hypothetical protein
MHVNFKPGFEAALGINLLFKRSGYQKKKKKSNFPNGRNWVQKS